MKSIWKYVSIGLIVLLVGVFSVSMYTQNELKDRIIELQSQRPDTTYVQVHDTIQFDSVIVKWKTRTVKDTLVASDTVWNDSIIIVNNFIEQPVDTFSSDISYNDSVINSNIHIVGRGVYEKTFIDSLRMDYNINTEVLIPKKKCCWLRKIFCGCD